MCYINCFKLTFSPQHKVQTCWLPAHCGISANTMEPGYKGTSLANEASLQRAKVRWFCLNIQCGLGKSFICMPQRIKPMKLENPLPRSKIQIPPATPPYRLSPCSSRVPWYLLGLHSREGQRSDYIWGQKVSLNLIIDSMLFLLLIFRELSAKYNTMFSWDLKSNR